MIIRLILDKRRADKYGNYPIKISIADNGRTRFISTGISINEKYWNDKNQFNPVRKTYADSDYLNSKLSKLLIEYRQNGGVLGVKNTVNKDCFNDYFRSQISLIKTNTKELFISTINKIESFNNDRLVFADINYKWLTDFNSWMMENGCKINTCSIHLRNIRTIFNKAINEDIISYDMYPFRKFKIQTAAKEKTYMPLDKFRLLVDYSPRTKGEQLAKDLWILSFCLCGCNTIDLWNMKPSIDGYVSFQRTKIKFREPYTINIKLHSYALSIVDRYSSNEYLIDLTHYEYYKSMYGVAKKKLKSIANAIGYPELTFYHARYSWATYAHKIGCPDSIISHGLGHIDSSTASRFYISFDWHLLDEWNDKIISSAMSFSRQPVQNSQT